MNLPNKLTISRFLLTIAFLAVMFSQVKYHQTIALVLFVAAALSDFLRLCDQDKFSPPAPVPPLSAVAQALKLIDHAQNRRLALVQPANQLVGNAKANPPTTGVLK